MSRPLDPRRGRTGIVLVVVIALLSSFSIACVGGDTPEVQRPVNQTKIRYEQFLSQAGVFGSAGMLSAPWIVSPEQDTEVEGEFEISGWSARPSDVSFGAEGDSAYVRLFVVPATVYENTGEYLGYEITSRSRVAAVDPSTGEWSLAATSIADTYKGECVVIAVTHLGDVEGGMESPPMAVWLSSADGDGKGGGQQWPAPEVTVYLATAMVRPDGDPEFATGSEERLDRLVEDVQRYYRDVSRGRVQVVLVKAIGLWEIEQSDQALAEDENLEGAYREHIMAALERVPERPGPGEVFSLLAAQPGDDARNDHGRSTHSISWYPWVFDDLGNACRGSFINLPLDQGGDQDMIGVVAHELAHGLGSFPAEGRRALPDLYENPTDGYTPSDFNNFFGARGDYFLMARNRAVSPCAYSQEWLGWLSYSDVSLDELNGAAASVRVPYLDGLLGPVGTVPRIVWQEPDGREAYTVIEARTNERGSWDTRLPKSGLLVYKIREAKAGERQEGQEYWPRSINWCALLDSDNREYYDVAEGYIVRLDGPLTQAASERALLTHAVNLDEIARVMISPLYGAVLRVAIPALPTGASRAYEEASAESTGTVAPDLDLHAYLADGTHIGMDYETGVYENPVEGALVSGDMVLDSEWIALPENARAGARFEVSSHDAAQYVEACVDSEAVRDLSLSYEVQPVAVDVVNGAIARGERLAGTLAPGEAASTAFQDSGVRLQPLRSADGEGRFPLAGWELVASAILTLFAIALVATPLRRR